MDLSSQGPFLPLSKNSAMEDPKASMIHVDPPGNLTLFVGSGDIQKTFVVSSTAMCLAVQFGVLCLTLKLISLKLTAQIAQFPFEMITQMLFYFSLTSFIYNS
ncbi:hypothetical protein N7G274_006975 [Stereocaulon virgatum]|uniref:Uncharacterized protein n=1 Tax=Stereocaulon virgatum TaxID=373712 RepID=A0ABR4A297_9LECA